VSQLGVGQGSKGRGDSTRRNYCTKYISRKATLKKLPIRKKFNIPKKNIFSRPASKLVFVYCQ